MSSAILYLAIVAIWAVFLIPAWIKRPHGGSAGRLDADGDDAFAPEAEFAPEADDDVVLDRYDTGSDRVEFEESEFDPEYDSDYAPQYAGEHEYAEDPGYADEDRYAGTRAGRSGAAPGGDPATDPGYGYEYAEAGFADEGGYPDEARAPGRARAAVAAPQSREQMLRARRRLLTILLGLTALTVAATAAGLVQWWICVPPVALLGLYVLLLREVAIADAESARRLAAHEAQAARAAHAAAVRRRRQEQAAAAAAARAAETTAEIIDISSRVSDQLFDQYAEDEARAVGD